MESVSENYFVSLDYTEQVGFIIYFDPVTITKKCVNKLHGILTHEFKWGSPE